MRTLCKMFCVMTLGLLVAGGILSAGDDSKPSAYYLQDDIQYYPASPEYKLVATHEPIAALGDLYFTDVVSVHFVGPGHPANPDGSLGGLVLGDYTQMKIYERYIVREATNSTGETFRELHPYETLGKIEQRFASPSCKAKQATN